MKLTGHKSILSGSVQIPASKSHTIRAITVASVAKGISTIRNPLISEDAKSAVTAFRAMGADINTSDQTAFKITGTNGIISAPENIVDIGNSGTTLRIATGMAALCRDDAFIRLTGDNQIKSRPVLPLLNSLNDLGATANSLNGNGCAPISVKGSLAGGKTVIECVTSQYLTSLLFAAPLAQGDSEIEVSLLNEPDYVQMTLDWLDRQQIRYENRNMRSFKIPGRQSYSSFDLPVPADFSSATFFMCAGTLIEGGITITGLDFNDSQPDKAVADYLKEMGADITVTADSVHINKSVLHGIDIDMNRTPDALPAMAVTAAFAKGTTRLLNVAQARKKETDRIKCMAKELTALGVKTKELEDGLIIHHCSKLQNAVLKGYDDHRIVMALSIALMAADLKESTIDTAEAMNITFPNYVHLMNSIGGKLEILK